jgi:hypothetical protein
MTGHGEPELAGSELQVFNEILKRQNIQVESLNLLNVGSIPAEARALVISGPKYDLSELEIKILSDFWEKQGRLLVTLNPFARTPRLSAWLAERGIVPQEDRVLRNGTFLARDQSGSPQLKTGPIFTAGFVVMDSGTNITKDLAGLSKQFIGTTQSLLLDRTREKTDKLRLIPLLESAKDFWGETDLSASEERPPFFDPKKDNVGPLTLGAAVEKGGVGDARVKVETSRMVVIGNAEVLTNTGYRSSEGITGDFAVNALNWLLDREELSGIAPKEKKNVTLALTEKQIGSIALTVMGIVPGLIAVLGIVNWWSRRS